MRGILNLPSLMAFGLMLWLPAAAGAGAEGEARPAPPPVAAAEDPCAHGNLGPVRVQIGAVEAHVRSGQLLPLPVRVKGVCNLARFEFWVQMDRRVADLARVEQTPFLAGSPPVDTEFIGLRAGVSRQVIAGARIPGSGGVDGVGTLARLILRGKGTGSTSIRLVRLALYDPDGNEIPTQLHEVRLTVTPTKPPRVGSRRRKLPPAQ